MKMRFVLMGVVVFLAAAITLIRFYKPLQIRPATSSAQAMAEAPSSSDPMQTRPVGYGRNDQVGRRTSGVGGVVPGVMP